MIHKISYYVIVTWAGVDRGRVTGFHSIGGTALSPHVETPLLVVIEGLYMTMRFGAMQQSDPAKDKSLSQRTSLLQNVLLQVAS